MASRTHASSTHTHAKEPATESSSPVVYMTTPPEVTVPVPPPGFVPVRLAQYRGYFPKAQQTHALPGAIKDLESFGDYSKVLGAAAPPPAPLAEALKREIKWAELRRAAETFFVYTRTMEVVSWKNTLGLLQQLDRAYQVVKTQAPDALTSHLELEQLLDAARRIGQRGASTRTRNKASKKGAEGEGK
jgi:hypothetical protein